MELGIARSNGQPSGEAPPSRVRPCLSEGRNSRCQANRIAERFRISVKAPRLVNVREMTTGARA